MDKLLLIGTNELEPILVAAAAIRGLERALTPLFLGQDELGRLLEIPAWRGGELEALVLGFPTPSLARDAEAARRVLAAARDVTWISAHPIDPVDRQVTAPLRQASGEGALWEAAAAAIGASPEAMTDELREVAAPLPEELPELEAASLSQRWRLALEAARQEPSRLGARARELAELAEPDPELVGSGRALIRSQRILARESHFHLFETPLGRAAMIMAPSTSLGFYESLAAEVRRHSRCRLSLLAFDSGEPVQIEFEEPPVDLAARLELARAMMPAHLVAAWGPRGFAVKGPTTNSLELLETIFALLGRTLS